MPRFSASGGVVARPCGPWKPQGHGKALPLGHQHFVRNVLSRESGEARRGGARRTLVDRKKGACDQSGGVDSDSNHDVCRGRYDMFEAFMIANLKASLKSTTAMFAQLCCDAMKCYDVAFSKSHKF